MYPTDLTVSAVVEDNGRYLIVEERAAGRTVFNQPGGHIEGGESPEVAVIRETLEETGCDVACGELIGVYLWIHPQTRQQFLRIAYVAKFLACDEQRKLDEAVVSRKWLTRQDLESRRDRLRSPLVLRCIRDYESGRRQTDILFSGMLPLQHHVDAVLATADLV